MRTVLVLAACVALGGCGGAQGTEDGSAASMPQVATPPVLAPEAARPAPAPLPQDAWAGRWIGPEGLFLTIAPTALRGEYALVVKGDLDSAGDPFTGTATGNGISFVRKRVTETIRHTDGDATGLKWLAGKRDCLTVKAGEGFCRD